MLVLGRPLFWHLSGLSPLSLWQPCFDWWQQKEWWNLRAGWRDNWLAQNDSVCSRESVRCSPEVGSETGVRERGGRRYHGVNEASRFASAHSFIILGSCLGRQTWLGSCCFIWEETHRRESERCDQTHSGGLANSILSNQSAVGGQKEKEKKTKTCTGNAHSRKSTHPRRATHKNYSICTHTHTHTHTHTLPFNTANLISSGRYSYTHANTRINHKLLFFPASQIKTPRLTHTHTHTRAQQIHTQHTPNQSDCQAGSRHFDPDGKRWLLWWQLAHLTSGL